MKRLLGLVAGVAALLALACGSDSSPTEPPPPAPTGAVRYSGTIAILAVDGVGSALSVRQSCGLSRTRAFVGQEFDFSVSFGDLPQQSPPGGRWGAELFGAAPFGCRMSYVRSAVATQLNDLFVSCSNPVASLSDAQIQTCNGSYASRVEPRLYLLPPFTDGAAAIQGEGRVEATMTFADGSGANIDQGLLDYAVRFDLRRGS